MKVSQSRNDDDGMTDLPPYSCYIGGYYHGQIVFPQEYPLKPPAIYMTTPSGRFQSNTR